MDEIVRRVKVNRNRSRREALEATNRELYVHWGIAEEAAKGEGDEVDLHYFQVPIPGEVIQNEEVLAEYRRRKLRPDLDAQCADNEAHPEFADGHPNATLWVDRQGRYCYALIDRWGGDREIDLRPRDGHWRGGRWFCGVSE